METTAQDQWIGHAALTYVSHRGDIDDPAAGRRWLDLGQQQEREQKVGQMIGLQLGLVAVVGLVLRAHHHARVVDQQVDLGLGCRQVLGALPDARQAAEVQLADYHLARVALERLPVWPGFFTEQ